MGLYSVSGEGVAALVPSVFADRHLEVDIQKWADRCPGLINGGLPMLSLGMEIVTKYNLYIDNLFIDGNGTIVAAEMKRGKSPRDVVAQVIDYASFVSGLDWDTVEQYCRKVHNRSLDDAFGAMFGRPLPRPEKPPYRLLLVTESYDPRVIDNAVYLINTGIPLALIQFTYFRVGEAEMIDTAVVFGEIPDQTLTSLPTVAATTIPAKPAQAAPEPSGPNQGYSAWLLPTLGKMLTETAERRGWQLRFNTTQQTLQFADTAWPLGLSDCRLHVDTYKKGVVALRLQFRTEAAPGLIDFLDRHRAEWADRYAGVMATPNYPTPNTLFTLELPHPAMGDQAAVAEMFVKVEAMAEALLPLVSAYFAQSTVPG